MLKTKVILILMLLMSSLSYSQKIRTPDNNIQGIMIVDQNGGVMQSVNGINFEVVSGNPNWNLLNEIPNITRTFTLETVNGTYTSTPTSEPYNFELNKSSPQIEKKDDSDYPFLGISNETYGNKLALDFSSPQNCEVDIYIINIDGNKLFNESKVKFNKGFQKYYIDISQLSKGGYIVSFSLNGMIISTKFIKE